MLRYHNIVFGAKKKYIKKIIKHHVINNKQYTYYHSNVKKKITI